MNCTSHRFDVVDVPNDLVDQSRIEIDDKRHAVLSSDHLTDVVENPLVFLSFLVLLPYC